MMHPQPIHAVAAFLTVVHFMLPRFFLGRIPSCLWQLPYLGDYFPLALHTQYTHSSLRAVTPPPPTRCWFPFFLVISPAPVSQTHASVLEMSARGGAEGGVRHSNTLAVGYWCVIEPRCLETKEQLWLFFI